MQWNKENTEKLAALYHKATAEEIARALGTTKRAVYKKANKLGLHKASPNAIIVTAEKKAWLIRNFPHVSNGICASILGMSIRSVVRNARKLGLEKTAQFRHECSLQNGHKGVEALARIGKLPPKGYYSPNLRKGEPYRFKRKTAVDHDIPATDKPLLGR
jgi:hypothetical protein